MSYPQPRGMNNALSEGSTDGKYKKITPDRENADPATYENRVDLSHQWYGLVEKKVKATPDGLLHATPNYVPNAPIAQVDSY